MENYNTRFIKKFSQLNFDMQSYRCKDFSLKQVSGLMRGPDPPVPSRTLPPGSATALVPFDILSTAFGINSNTPISSCRFTFWTWNTISIMYRSNRSFNMPPRATPPAFDFFENYCSNSPLPGPKCRSNAPHWGPFRWSNAPTRGHFTGTKMTEGRRKRLRLSNKIFINITKTEKHC